MRPKSLQLVEDDAHDGSPWHAWHLKETPGDRIGDFCELIQEFDTVFCFARHMGDLMHLLSFSCLLIAGKLPISINIRICWRILDISFFSYLLDSASLCSPNLALTWNILTHHPCEKKNPCSVAKATTWSIPRRGQRHLEGSLMIFVPALVKFRKTGFYTVSWNSQRWDRIYCKQTCIITAHKQGTNSMIHDVSHPWKPNSCGQRSWCCPCLLHPSWSQSPLRTTNGASNNLYALFWIPICLSHSSDMVKFEPVLTWPLQRLHQHERQWRQWSNKQMEGLYELDCPTMPLRPLFLQRQQTIIIKTCKGRKRHFPDPWDR